MSPAPDYTIRSLCYAHVDLPAEFFGGVPIHSMEGTKTAAMHYLLISSKDGGGKEHHYLVDCGFADEEWIGRFGFYDWESPETVLARVGLKPSDIEKVFVTHMHFDHINALSYFPHAHLYMQRQEFDGWADVLTLPPHFTPMGPNSWITSSFHRDDFARIGEFAARGQLHFVEDGDGLLPGIAVHLSGGHTFGIQWLSAETSGGSYALASDTVFWYSNVEEMWPAGYTNGDTWKMLLTFGQIYEYVNGEIDRIVPGHDMQIYERNPSWKDGLNEVAEIHVASWDKSKRPAAVA